MQGNQIIQHFWNVSFIFGRFWEISQLLLVTLPVCDFEFQNYLPLHGFFWCTNSSYVLLVLHMLHSQDKRMNWHLEYIHLKFRMCIFISINIEILPPWDWTCIHNYQSVLVENNCTLIYNYRSGVQGGIGLKACMIQWCLFNSRPVKLAGGRSPTH